MSLYSYIVTSDSGFSPNPFFGVCTLACCKPGIRRTAIEGDWIVGLTPKSDGNRLVYYMNVEKTVGFRNYWTGFKRKRPNPNGGPREMRGDNIYQPQPGGGFRQLPSRHSKPAFSKHEDLQTKRRDLGGEKVLISKQFAYFGSDPKELPPELKETLQVGRGYRRLPDQVAADFEATVRKKGWGFGVQARPRRWPRNDESWMPVGCSR